MSVIRITDGNAFKLRITGQTSIEGKTSPVDMSVISSLVVNFFRRGRQPQTSTVDANGRIVAENAGNLAIGEYGVEMTGYYNGQPWRFFEADVFEIVRETDEHDEPSEVDVVPIYDVAITVSLGGNGVTPAYVTAAIEMHDSDEDAHPDKYVKPENGIPVSDLSEEVQDMIENGGKTKAISVNGGEPFTPDETGLVNLEIPSPQILIDETVTGEPGTDAEVENVGTDEAPVLKFSIPRGEQGEEGESAYQIAVENGFVGTEEEWLESLRGPKGDTGNSAIFDPHGQTVIVTLANELGSSTEIGMTQKAISDALGYEEDDLVGELEDGFYSSRTIGLSPTKNTSYGSTYKCYRTSEVGVGWTYKYKMQATNSGACWAKLKDGKITEFCPTASGQVGEGTVVCDGTFDEILFNTNNGLSDKVLERCYNAMDGITEQLEQIIPAVESHEATLTKEEDILDEFEDGYIATTVGSEVPAPNLISGWSHVRTNKVEVGYSYDFNLSSGATGRCWAKVKEGVIIETSTEESSHTNSGTVVCDGTFDELIFNTAVSYGQKVLKRKRSFESLVNDAAIHGLGLQQRNHRQRIEYLEQCINTGMPWNGMALPSRPSEFKILAIGNSFTGNTFRYLVAMLESLGISGNVTYGYTFASGNSLANEVTQFDNESSAGSLNYIKQGGAAVIVQNCTIQQALDYDDWDVVMLQQASGSSANWKSYSDLAELVKRIRLYTKNRPKIVFNLTWATGNQTADLYGGMYGMYVELMNVAVMLRDKYGLDIVIPQYQSFQMVRNDSISEGMAGLLDSASYHANDYGQIVAGLTIIEALIGVPFNKSIRGVTYRNDYLTDDNAATLINLVRQAVAYPYNVLPDVNEEEE